MRFHHVNLAVHPDLLDAEMAFLSTGLGLQRVDPGPELAERARWFSFPDGLQVHLSRTTDRIATRPGHIAVDVGGEMGAIVGRLAEGGMLAEETRTTDGRPSVRIVSDPAGHVWELRPS